MTTSENTPKKNDTYRVDQPRFMSADEIAQTCGISRTTAYRLIRKLNLQLEQKKKSRSLAKSTTATSKKWRSFD